MSGDDRRLADDSDGESLETGLEQRLPKQRQRVHSPDPLVDDVRIVVLPAGLVLFGSSMVIDGEDHGARLTGRGGEPDRRSPTVRTDLHERSAGNGPGRGEGGGVKGITFVRRHEPLGGQGDVAPTRHR